MPGQVLVVVGPVGERAEQGDVQRVLCRHVGEVVGDERGCRRRKRVSILSNDRVPIEPGAVQVDLPREVWRRLVERGHLRDDDLPTGLDRTSLDRLHQAYQQRKPKPVLTMLAQPSATRLVLLGDPGSGKSTLARYLALTLAGGARLPVELAPLADVTPIVIELRVYISDTWGGGDFLDLLDFQ
ncbi:hypothetical protein ACIO93_35725 [Streptomyces sp. NPDC087903]|uniref:hypothetical protein n=1 Tax=Streptomyces sp. NPDC087903 TaxID=3365819 RepID=UPI003820BD5B